MGWVWKEEPDYSEKSHDSSGDLCSTSKVVRSKCNTEEVEPGKFVRKCEKTEEILRECVGKPIEVVKSTKEYTEDDITDQMLRGSPSSGAFNNGAFDFPGLRNDIEGIERHLFGGIRSLFDAAEEVKNSFFDVFGDLPDGQSSSSPSMRRGIPIEGHHPQGEISTEPQKVESGHIDLSGLARDV